MKRDPSGVRSADRPRRSFLVVLSRGGPPPGRYHDRVPPQHQRPARPLPRPIRAVLVEHVRYNCAGDFAVAWADFEPAAQGQGADDAFGFVVAVPPRCRVPERPLPPEMAEAFGAGVLAQWKEEGGGACPFAVRVILRDAIWDDTFSKSASFRMAGAFAAYEALTSLAEGRPPSPVVTSPIRRESRRPQMRRLPALPAPRRLDVE